MGDGAQEKGLCILQDCVTVRIIHPGGDGGGQGTQVIEGDYEERTAAITFVGLIGLIWESAVCVFSRMAAIVSIYLWVGRC